MWKETTMSLGNSLLASAMGFLIVFLVLIFLALVIIVFAKVFNATAGKKAPAAAAAAPAAPAMPEKDDSETIAIVTSAICEELNADPGELRINGIREV